MVDRRILFNRDLFSKYSLCNNPSIIVNSNKGNNNNNNNIPKYIKVYIEDPFSNRKIIFKVAKNQKGVYV